MIGLCLRASDYLQAAECWWRVSQLALQRASTEDWKVAIGLCLPPSEALLDLLLSMPRMKKIQLPHIPHPRPRNVKKRSLIILDKELDEVTTDSESVTSLTSERKDNG